MKGFKAFLLRGNVVELAVAVVIGAAFSNIVNAFVKDIINPVIGLVGTENLDNYYWCLKDTCQVSDGEIKSGVAIAYGSVAGAVLTFAMTAAVVYFGLILPMNKLNERRKAGKEPEVPKATELDLLAEIRDLLAREAEASAGSGPGGGTVPAPADRGGSAKTLQ